MGLLENIRNECKRQNITVKKLESDLGFSNGFISKVKGNNMKSDRLYKVAEYLNVEPEYLLTGKETTTVRSAVMQELLDAAEGCTPEDIHLASDMLHRLKAYHRLIAAQNGQNKLI